MFAPRKKSLIAALFAAMFTLGLAACGSAQPTSAVLHERFPAAVVDVSSIELDQYPQAQADVARLAGVDTDVMYHLQPAGKVQLTALALCQSLRVDVDDVAGTLREANELYYSAGQIAAVYSPVVTNESLRVNDSLRDLNRRVVDACPNEAAATGWIIP